LRNKKVDEIIEGMFGKPDYTCSQVIEGEVYTPLSGNPFMIRVDPIGIDINLLNENRTVIRMTDDQKGRMEDEHVRLP
jgi:hypothetical protein